MANPIKGEVAFEHDGKKYLFVLGFLAMAQLERKTGKTVQEISQSLGGVKVLVDVFQAGMLRHHGTMTEAELTDLMDSMGMDKINEVLGEAIQLMSEKVGGQGAENPLPARMEGNGASPSFIANG